MKASLSIFLAVAFVCLAPARSRRFAAESGGAHERAHRTNYCTTCERDASGRIKRSSAVRRAFRAAHPCPSTGKVSGPCPGYVVDHMTALKHGGQDVPGNMQWQSVAEAKWKDWIEYQQPAPLILRG